jgi:hypothetical protein
MQKQQREAGRDTWKNLLIRVSDSFLNDIFLPRDEGYGLQPVRFRYERNWALAAEGKNPQRLKPIILIIQTYGLKPVPFTT